MSNQSEENARLFRLAIVVIVVAGSLGLFGCKPGKNVTGQVFIVTAGAENIPLGDVEINLIDKREVLQFMEQKKQSIAEGIESRRRNVEERKEALESAEAKAALFATQQSYDNFMESDTVLTNAEYFAVRTNRDKILSGLNALKPKLLSLQQQNRQQNANVEKTQVAGPRGSGIVYIPSIGTSTANILQASFDFKNEISKVLENLQRPDFDALLFDNFRAGREASGISPLGGLSPNQRPLQSFLVNADASLKTIVEFVRTNESELVALKSQIESKIAQPYHDTQSGLNAAMDGLNAAKAELNSYPSAGTYFADFSPGIIASVHSDAEGKFALRYPPGREFAIFARAQRETPNGSEQFFWLVNAPPERIILSNGELISADPDGYFTFKPK